jgi:nicotinate-nucleotide adenylyltransferase
MRVALFGGSFNPPHLGHQLAALYVLETAAIDELWFVPCFKHAFEKALVPFDDRYRMCELAAQALGPRARVSDIERTLGAESRTLRTVRALEARHPAHRFSVVIGGDLETEVDSWYGADELRRAAPFIVVARAGATQAAQAPPGVAMPAISSTEIRTALGQGKPASGLVSRAVLDYVYACGLFGAHKPA